MLGYSQPEATLADADVPLSNLLNACTFYVEYNDALAKYPQFIQNLLSGQKKSGYRLMELWQPSEELQVYATTLAQMKTAPAKAYDWFRVPLADPKVPVHVLAENVIMLVIWPRRVEKTGAQLTDDYNYDSRAYLQDPAATLSANQLPPVLEVTMVALAQSSAQRMEDEYGSKGLVPPPLEKVNCL
ncbi:MAG: hypothetical protein HC904_00990 [Blastochloris sp.]|nr:hypothetical protein [Blastochloris sp.]